MKTSQLILNGCIAIFIFTSTTVVAKVITDTKKTFQFKKAVEIVSIDNIEIEDNDRSISLQDHKANNLVYAVNKRKKTLTIYKRKDVISYYQKNGHIDRTIKVSKFAPWLEKKQTASNPAPLKEIYIKDEKVLSKLQQHINGQKNSAISVWQRDDSDVVYIVDRFTETLTIHRQPKESNVPTVSNIPIKIGTGSLSVIANLDDTRAYVANPMDGTISVVDVEQNKVVSKMKVDGEPYCLLYGANDTMLYVITRKGDKVFLINSATKSVIREKSIKDLPPKFIYDQCYKSCHQDKRDQMDKARKPLIPNHQLKQAKPKFQNNGLRSAQQRKFIQHYYQDYLDNQTKIKKTKNTSFIEKVFGLNDHTLDKQNPFAIRDLSHPKKGMPVFDDAPIITNLDEVDVRIMSDIEQDILSDTELPKRMVEPQNEWWIREEAELDR